VKRGKGLLIGLLRCGHCGRKLMVRYWGRSGSDGQYYIQQLQNKVLKIKSPIYVFNIMRLLRQVLNVAVKWEVISSNPSLRHTFVSVLIREGIPTADVQKLARHASYQTTIDIYHHLLPDELRKGLNKIDILLQSIEESIEKRRNINSH